MPRKRYGKGHSRWHPLHENASILQVLTVPEVDDFTIRLDDMSREELSNFSKFIEQSNKSIEVENLMIETYLNRVEPGTLEKMTQILDATAAALQKTERTAHLGPGASSMSLTNTAKRVTPDGSVSESSRVDSIKTTNSLANKVGVFNLNADKGPRVQCLQKIEIANREIEEVKNALEAFRKKAKTFNYILTCRTEEMKVRLQEIVDAQNNFEQKLLIEGIDPITGKLPGERFLRYLETRLKQEETEIDRMRIKTGSLKTRLKMVGQELAQKEELGEILHAVDFEQLQIENKECQERLDEKISYVTEVKRINGHYGNLLNANRKKLEEQLTHLASLQQNVVTKEKMIKQFVEDELKINFEINKVTKRVDKIFRLMKSYTVPDLMDYIKKKAELHEIKKNIKVCERQVKLRELALASQVHRVKSAHEEFSKSITHLTDSPSSHINL